MTYDDCVERLKWISLDSGSAGPDEWYRKWGDRDRPDSHALELASVALKHLPMPVDRVAPDIDGGIVFQWVSGDLYADMTVYNSDTGVGMCDEKLYILWLISDRKEKTECRACDPTEEDIAKAALYIGRFLDTGVVSNPN